MRKRTLIAAGCAACLMLAPAAHARQALVERSQKPGQWPMVAKNYANTRFSELDQINAENVDELTLAWAFSTGVLRGHEAAPLVIDDTMYIVTPWPNILYALDLEKRAMKWAYAPHPASAAKGVACCDWVNRGAAYADGKIFFNTLDNHTVAVDAETGKEVWKVKLGDISRGQTMTMAPLVVKDRVLVGISGGEFGVRGWLTALDIDTGEIVWRAWSTGPDEDVRIGERFDPAYGRAEGVDLGVVTWPSRFAWMRGGGTVWGFISYDPEADLIYYGTGNPAPWNAEQRRGANKWTSSIFARDPDTGSAVWAYQVNPHDPFSYGAINENLLLDLKIDGEMRKTLVHADKNGWFYVLDRLTGEIISAEPFVDVNTIERINMDSGRPIYNEDKIPQVGRTVTEICPSSAGGKNWPPMAWSPETGYVYIPANNLCMSMTYRDVAYIAGTPYEGMESVLSPGKSPGEDKHRGVLQARDPVTNEPVWKIKEKFPVWSGVVATGGGLVFYGTMNRWFKAVDAKTGEVLWKFRTGSGIVGQPITYRGPDGRQYVAVLAGIGGWPGTVVADELDTSVPFAANGFMGALQDLHKYTDEGGMLYVFALPKREPDVEP